MNCLRFTSMVSVAFAVMMVFATGCQPSSEGDRGAATPAGDQVAEDQPADDQGADYPEFDSSQFERPTTIDNEWFPLKPGTRFVWDGTSVDEEGDVEAHSVVFTVTDLTKEIDGVQTVVCWDQDFVDGELEEWEIVFFAQDNAGAVWHFGQYPEELSDGEVVETPGWLHGVKDGRAGIHMPADPKLGDPSFSQGWAPSIPWTDRAVVFKTGEKVKVEAGEYEDVLVIDESNREEPDAHQLKYYARGVGNVKVGFRGEEETQEELELMRVEQISPEELDEARKSALQLEANANEHCKDIFADTKPMERSE